MTDKTRIDQILVMRGFCESREQAQRAIMAGRVFVGGQKADKASLLVSREAAIEVQSSEKYV